MKDFTHKGCDPVDAFSVSTCVVELCHFAKSFLLAVVCVASPAMWAQTADPSATPSSPAVAAPPAKAGTYAVAQGDIVAGPGLIVPNGNLPWALDSMDGRSMLVPVHHSSINEPPQSDAVPSTPEPDHLLDGPHARTVLHGPQPVFFIHTSDRTENTGDTGRGNPTGWVLVAAAPAQGDKRSFPHVRFTQIAMATSCAAPVLCVQAESLPDGWLRISPKSPLPPGDYALLPVPRQPKPGVVVVYDFRVDPGAPQAKDAVLPGQAPAPASKHKKH